MKKRIVCFLLTLIMLVSLVPVTALTASAASLSVSEKAINVLKKMTTYKSKCYQIAKTQEFHIGYGTVCEKSHNVDKNGNWDKDAHTISQKDADNALRAALKNLDKKVNSFASSNGLSLKQNQHDALVIFSFDSGTAWMSGNGVVKTAIVKGADSNELLNAMNEWTKLADTNRRKVEVNMYMNNVYSNVVPSNYSTVKYDANGGTMAQGTPYTMQYDKSTTAEHDPVPTRSGWTFVGWYRDKVEWMPTLTSACADKTLFAMWQPRGYVAGNNAGVEVNYTLAKSRLASRSIYNWPDLNAKDCKKTGKVESSTVTVVRDFLGSDGTRWSKLSGGGWVIVKAGSNGVSNGSGTDIDVTVTVTNDYLNARVNETIYSQQNGTFKRGDRLRIINTAQNDGFLWGQVAKSDDDDTPICWVALMYTNWNSVKDQGASNGSSSNSKAVAKATITYKGYVHVRSDAGTSNKIVGSLAQNETVDVYEIKTVNGHQWGRTNAGWFCMTYASVNMLSNSNISDIVSDEGALSYAFAGTASEKLEPRVKPVENSNKTSYQVSKGTAVTVTNMVVAGQETWGKIVWRVDTDNDGKADTNKTGWVRVKENNKLEGACDLEGGGSPISINTARFQVVSDTKIRRDANNGGETLFAMVPGVEFEVTKIKLVGEDIWGYTSVDESATRDYIGWVNLASKYVKRINAPTIEPDKTTHTTGKMATVVNTDSVRIREHGATYGKVIGSLSRGSTVAVWEADEDGKWYKIDSNKNGKYDYDGDGWAYVDYLNITEGTTTNTTTNNGGSTSNSGSSSSSGTGIVANTYSGVNVRSGAGVGNAFVCKLLPGTQVEILETKTVGAAKWGRVAQGWVCMDYIAMISYDQIPGNNSGSNTSNGTGTGVDSLDKVDKTTTTAVYTGRTEESVNVYATPALESGSLEGKEIVDTLDAGDPITMYELVAVTEICHEDPENGKVNETEEDKKQGGGTTTTTTITSYWARVNGGYIYDPAHNLILDALDEKVHTLTGSDTLNVRESPTINSTAIESAKLKKGDQVSVTALRIENDKVWGRIELDDVAGEHYGWIRLDYMSEGAYYVNQAPAPTTPAPSAPVIGSTGNTGSAGIANNTSGYKYTGKVINTDSVHVRNMPSTNAAINTDLKKGASLVIYETTIADNMAWGRCDAGWVYLYYVDMTPSGGSAIDARVVYNDNTIAYTDSDCSEVAGTYSRMSVVDIYEVVGSMVRTDLGWVNTTDLLN